MNKLFTKIATAIAGFAMVAGVGVGIGLNVNKQATKADAATGDTTSISIFDYATANSWSSGTQYASMALDSYISCSMSDSTYTGTYHSTDGWKLYESDSGTFTISASSGASITHITILWANAKNKGCLKQGSNNFASDTRTAISGTSIVFTASHSSGSNKGQVGIKSVRVEYTYTPSEPQQLAAPTNVSYNNGQRKVAWDSVTGATGYQYTVDNGVNWNNVSNSSERYHDVSSWADNADYSVKIRATGDGTNYEQYGEASNACEFTKSPLPTYESVVISKGSLTGEIKGAAYIQCSAVVNGENNPSQDVTWSITSSNAFGNGTEIANKANIDQNGKVTFLDNVADPLYVWALAADGETKGNTTVSASGLYAPGTEEHPYTVALAKVAIDDDADHIIDDVYVKGIVSQVDSYNSTYHSVTYWISDDGTTTDQFEVYGGKGLNGANFNAEADVKVKSTVVIKGKIKLFTQNQNSIYEFDKDNIQISCVEPLTVDFNTHGGSSVDSQTVAYGQTAQRPANPTKESDTENNYSFDDWYTSDSFGETYNFSSPVTANLVLHANWNSTPVPASDLIKQLDTQTKLSYHYSSDTNTVTDTLNKALTETSGSGYKDWSGKQDVSSAVYSGSCVGNVNYIQIKSGSGCGIVSTISGGLVKKIVVSWNDSTEKDRTLDVYGTNTAYSSSSDLYNNSTRGTKLGSIVKGTSTELTITGSYQYVGLRSNDGAMYIDSISIDWDEVSFEYSDISIRFGATLNKALWDRLDTNEHVISGFGVMITENRNIGENETIEEWSGAATLAEDSTDTYNNIVDYYMSKAEMSVPPEVGDNYVWNLFQAIDEADIAKVFVAAAYIKVGNERVFLNQVRYSAKTLAAEYIATNRDGCNAQTAGGSLRAMSTWTPAQA